MECLQNLHKTFENIALLTFKLTTQASQFWLKESAFTVSLPHKAGSPVTRRLIWNYIHSRGFSPETYNKVYQLLQAKIGKIHVKYTFI